jgi:thiamine transporter ThiT
MESGSHELSRMATAYMASLAFVATFLIATATGSDGGTALVRGVVVGALALVLGRLLVRPLIDTVLDAMARDEARKAAERSEDER